MIPDMRRGLEGHVDASFPGEWNKTWSEEPTFVLSRTGFIIVYANNMIIWTSKLHTKIILSTTEIEYVTLSHAMREAILLMNLLNELKDYTRISGNEKAKFSCKT
eukprot:7909949-Ditylum_brightwellii.AAC.1